MKKLEPNEQRAKNVIISIMIVLIFEIALLILNFYKYNMLQAIKNDEFGILDAVDAIETMDIRIGTASII